MLLYGALAVPSHASDNPQSDLAKLQARITQITATLNQDKAELDSTQEALARVEKTMGDLNRSISETQSGMQTKTGMIMESEAEIFELENAIVTGRDQLKRLIVASYINGQAEYFKLLLNQEDPAIVGRILAYYRYLTHQRVGELLQFAAVASRLHLVKVELETEQEELKEQEAAQVIKRAELSKARTERAGLVTRLQRDIESKQQQLDRLKQNASRLERLLEDLGGVTLDISSDSTMNLRFGDMRGKLQLPAPGIISAYYGQSRGGTEISWKGIFMDADEGTAVRAIFPGRVVFADWLRGFGLLLILDHGDGFMSLYSHNQQLFKQIGEWADTGEQVGQVGSSGGLTESGLYFEIRQNGEPRDPLIWCKVE